MYKTVKCEKTIMGQLHYGDDLIESMLTVCKEEGITAGCFELMGAVSRVKLAYYDQVEKRYSTCFESETGCEITLRCLVRLFLPRNSWCINSVMRFLNVSLTRSLTLIFGNYIKRNKVDLPFTGTRYSNIRIKNEHKIPPNSMNNLLKDKDKQYVWHPFTQMKDWVKDDIIVIAAGEGSYLIDTDGKRYIDGVSSLWCNVHGHRKKELDQAVKDQLGKIAHSTFLGLSNVPAIELAEKLIAIAPCGLKRVFYSDSGAAAVEVGLKMAYQYWQQKPGGARKKKFLHLTNSYHGDTLGSVSVGGIDLFHKVYSSLLFDTIATPAPYCYRCSFGKEPASCHKECIRALEDTVTRHKDELAALVIEPVMLGAAGMLKQPQPFIIAARKVTAASNVLLMCDEVATGFGRTGQMFACDTGNVTPDLMVVGKGITGGYLPLSATLATEEIYNGFLGKFEDMKTFFHGHTYTANPLAAAVASANLDLFREERTLEKLQPKIELMTKRLKEIAVLAPVGDVRQAGFMVGIELVKDKKAKRSYPVQERMGHQVITKARERNVIIRPLGDVIVLMPPLSIEDDVLEELLSVVKWAIEGITS